MPRFSSGTRIRRIGLKTPPDRNRSRFVALFSNMPTREAYSLRQRPKRVRLSIRRWLSNDLLSTQVSASTIGGKISPTPLWSRGQTNKNTIQDFLCRKDHILTVLTPVFCKYLFRMPWWFDTVSEIRRVNPPSIRGNTIDRRY